MSADMIGFVLLGIVFVVLAYVGAAIAFAHYELGTFYAVIPPDRFGVVVRGRDPVGLVYNSLKFKLIYDARCPLGKFVLRSEPGEELQKLGWFEEMLGVRLIGIPFIHSLLTKKLSWYSVDGSDLVEKKEQSVSFFAITKTFGFKPKELTLGSDTNSSQSPSQGQKPGKKKDDQKLQRILVNLMYSVQCTIEDVYLAIISTDWMVGTEAMLGRYSQSTLGTLSQDELIADTGRGQLVTNIISNLPDIEVYGVRFDKDKIVYMDYELAGGEDVAKRIQEANTRRYESEQEAAGTRLKKAASQQDLAEQGKFLLQTVQQLVKKGLTAEKAAEVAQSMLKNQALKETKVQTYVEGGADVKATIPTK